jgi:hypothetical protein
MSRSVTYTNLEAISPPLTSKAIFAAARDIKSNQTGIPFLAPKKVLKIASTIATQERKQEIQKVNAGATTTGRDVTPC